MHTTRCVRLGLVVVAAGLALPVMAAELTVGPGKTYAKPSLAAAACANGDTISIDAGTYTNDVCTWTRSNLVVRGVGGMVRIPVGFNVVAGGKAIWVMSGSNITVQNVEFSGAAIPGDGSVGSRNAAGIRSEGAGLTVSNCYFHDNQNGILCGANASSDILVENSEFASNGDGDGYTHNLYIGAIRKLTFRGNYTHHTKVGHNLKTRALASYIIGNRIMDEVTGTSSFAIDVPNGGLTYLIGNLIQQGNASSNRSVIVNYGEEGAVNPSQHLYVANNTIVNDYTGAGGTTFLNIAATTTVARVENNIFLGQGTAIGGTPTSNLRNLVTTTSPLVNRAGFDYHLLAGSAAVDAAADPGSFEGQALLPTSQYVHPQATETRTTSGAAPDIGAYEYAAVANAAPVITEGASTTLTVNEDVAGSVALNATDGNGDTLSWSIVTQGSKGVAAVSGTGAAKSVGYTPTANLNGADSFVVQVSDGRGGTDTITVNVTITAVNDAPVVASAIPDQSATVGTAFSYVVPVGTITDVDGTTLTWSSNEALGWLSFTAGTRTFAGTPAAGDVAATTITVTASDGSLSASDSFVLTVTSVANAVPVVSAATAGAVTDRTSALSATASDDGGEPALIYTWSATGPAAVAFSPNGTNAAKASVATFSAVGSYVLTVTVRDAGGLTATRTASVTVPAVATSVAVTPASVSVATGATTTFAASVRDQFTVALATQPALTWTVSGGGSIASTGVFTAGATAGGPFTVTATSGALSGTAAVTVTTVVNAAPVASAATATAVTDRTSALSATASDDGGEPALVYTWSATGPAAVTFSPNGTNAAKTSVATFGAVGSYALTVTVRDAGGLTATRTAAAVVPAVATSIALTPGSISVAAGATTNFAASVRDQFSVALASQPALTWTVSGGGGIAPTGIFTAGATAGGPFTVAAASGALSGTAAVTVTGSSGTPASASEAGGGGGGGCGAGGALALFVLPLAGCGLRRRRR